MKQKMRTTKGGVSDQTMLARKDNSSQEAASPLLIICISRSLLTNKRPRFFVLIFTGAIRNPE